MARKEPIRVRPPRELDRFNDPIGEVPEWVEIPGATCVPRNSQEDDRRGTIIIAGFMVVLPSKVKDVLGADVPLDDDWEIEIRGKVYQIEGALADYGRRLIFYTMRAES